MLKLIVLEDEPAVRRELVLLTPWEDLGIVCAGEAGDGFEGLALAERTDPDIVITDIRMPGMDGLAFAEELSKRAAAADRPPPEVIILSGYSEFEYARTAMRFGISEYLLKPVDDEAMKAALTRAKSRIAARSARALVEKSLFIEYEPKSDADQRPGYVDAAVRLMKDRYIQGVSIDEAAEALGISSSYLSRLFKQETGYTFVDYLMHIRVKRAAELLRDPTVRVYEVADLVGYADARYFGQIFKKITGMTPREFKDGIDGRPRRIPTAAE